MTIDLTRLIHNFIEQINIDEIFSFDSSYIENTDIKELNEVKITGSIAKSSSHIYHLNLNIVGVMILPCALTLEDVNYPFSLEINEILSDDDEKDEKYLKINGNNIDILPIIWQNIVLEVPLRVVSDNAYKAQQVGDGWRLITDEPENNKPIDSRLSKLHDLLDD